MFQAKASKGDVNPTASKVLHIHPLVSPKERYNVSSGGCYPWTRLGYSYDWENPGSEIGRSEFIIFGDSTIETHSITETFNYFP